MASTASSDRVAIVGMGCTNFGEHWDKGVDDLLIESSTGRHGSRPASPATTSTPTGSAPWPRAMSGLDAVPGRCGWSTSRSPGSRTCAPPAPRPCATPATRWPRGAYDVAMAIGVEKLKDSGFSGLVVLDPANDGTARPTPPRRPRSRLLAPAYANKYGVDERRAEGGADPHRLEEPPQRRPQPPGPVPQGGGQWRPSAASPADRRHARHLRLLGGVGRLGGRHRRAGRGRPPLHRQAALREGAVVRRRPGPGTIDPDYDFTTFPEVVASRRGRLRAGRGARSRGRAGHGRGARLLHARPSWS